MKCKSSLIWLIQFFVVVVDFFFLESVSGDLIWNTPLGTTLDSYDGLVSHFLGQLCRHRTLGGVRPLHVGHEQAHLLIGPPPLWVQLTVIPKGHLRLEGGGGREAGEEKSGTSIKTQRKILRCEGVRMQDRNDTTQLCRKVYLPQLFLSNDSGGEDKMLRFLEKILKSQCNLWLNNTTQ